MNFNKIYEVTHNPDAPLPPSPVRKAEEQEDQSKSQISTIRKFARDLLKSSTKITQEHIVDYTRDNYNLNLGDKIKTPIEYVLMGEGKHVNWNNKGLDLFEKLNDKDRKSVIMKIRMTLEKPQMIIRFSASDSELSDGRHNGKIYLRSFDNTILQGGKAYQPFLVVVLDWVEDKEERVISAYDAKKE
jgi:hypothetical protein